MAENDTENLLTALKSPDSQIRYQAVKSLKDLTDVTFIPQLLNILTADEDVSIRWEAALVLGNYKEAAKDLFKILETLEDSNDYHVQKSNVNLCIDIAFALSRMKEHSLVDSFLTLFNKNSAIAKIAALRCLAYYKDERIFEILLKELHNSNIEIRKAAIAALGNVDREEVFPILKKLLKTDRNDEIRINALGAMSELNDQRVLKTLTYYAEHGRNIGGADDYPVRRFAKTALTHFKEKWGISAS